MSFKKANQLGKDGIPFLIVSDYKKENVLTIPLSELNKNDIEFSIEDKNISYRKINFQKTPVLIGEYKEKFKKIIDSIKNGYTYVMNLTQETEVCIDSDLKEIYKYAKAKYKIRFKDKFISYSPETFIKIENNLISTFPMKGTLDASILNGEEILLNNPKESAEHIMIVDLLRNDLNMISSKVRVERFKYIEKINTGDKELLQMSSKIVGNLESGWEGRIGDILETMLPAGSITGTPKIKTVELIDKVEEYERGFFTGIFGVFQNGKFDSGVMIRFLENRNGKFIYKSGGGITLDSDFDSEYREMIEKVYLF